MWLEQFSDNIERRIIFDLIRKMKFYNEILVREKIKLIHRYVEKEFRIELGVGEKDRSDIIISSFGRIGKSAPYYVRLYRQENKIVSRNIVPKENIYKSIQQSKKEIKALIFIDDVIGSGKTAEKDLIFLNEKYGEILKNRKIKVYITAICAYEEGIERLKTLKNTGTIKFDFEVIYGEEILMKDTCNSPASYHYNNQIEYEKTTNLIKKHHQRIKIRNKDITAFGYGDNGLLVVFYESCPNNTLPILWHKSENWNALFQR